MNVDGVEGVFDIPADGYIGNEKDGLVAWDVNRVVGFPCFGTRTTQAIFRKFDIFAVIEMR